MKVFNLDFREKTSLNLITNIVRTLVMSLIGIFMVPYYVDNLGLASYAIIPLATTMSSYIQIISDSIANASVRYNTLAFDEGDIVKANRTLSSSFFGTLRICLFVLPLGILLAVVSPAIFSITGSGATEVQILFAMVILSSLIVTVSSPFEGLFYSRNNLYHMFVAKIAYSVGQVAIIILLFIFTEPSLIDIGVGYLFSSVLVFFLLWWFAKRTEPTMQIRKRLYDSVLFKKIGTLGVWTILSKLGGMLYIQLSMVLVNLYLGAEMQGSFAIVATVISMMNTACLAISDTIDPFIYRSYSEKKYDELQNILCTGTKLVTVIIAFPIAFFIVFSPDFLTAWLGSEYAYLSKMIWIGLLGNMLYCSVAPMIIVPRIYLKMERLTLVTFLIGLINALVTMLVLGVYQGSNESAIMVWAVCTLALSVFTIIYNILITHANYVKMILPGVIGYVILMVCCPLLTVFRDIIDIPPRWIPLIAVFLIVYLIFLMVAYRVFFTKSERTMVKTLLPQRISKYLR